MLLFIFSLIYQLIYLFFLRKKDNKKFVETLILFLISGITSLSVFMLIDFISDFINGYTPTDWGGNSLGYTVYGIKAITTQLKSIIYIPYIFINSVILIIYKLKARKKP